AHAESSAATAAATSEPRSVLVDIGDLPVARDLPALDRVPVVDRAERHVEAAQCDELAERRLHVAGVVDGAALQHGRAPAVPPPGKAEARVAERQPRRPRPGL